MKKLLLVLALASGLRADVVGPSPMQIPDSGGIWPLSGSVTYAINNALTGAASAAIDLSGDNGVYLTLSSSANSLVSVYFSNSNVSPTTGAIPAYQLQSPGNYYVPIKARYLSFVHNGQKAGVRLSAYYYVAAPNINITVPTPTPGTMPVTVTSQVGYELLTSTAYTGLTTNAKTTIGLTLTAGTGYSTMLVKLWAKTGVTSIGALIHGTATPPTTFVAGTGPEYFPSDNAKFISAPINVNGSTVYYLSMLANALSGATSGTVYLEIYGMR
jgi:hypothetical protein